MIYTSFPGTAICVVARMKESNSFILKNTLQDTPFDFNIDRKLDQIDLGSLLPPYLEKSKIEIYLPLPPYPWKTPNSLGIDFQYFFEKKLE